MNQELVSYVNQTFNMQVTSSASREQLEDLLAERINQLIVQDFASLVQLLYRIDVNEQKLKSLLKENTGTDAARIIAVLIIERQLQKKSSRQSHRDDSNIVDDSERW